MVIYVYLLFLNNLMFSLKYFATAKTTEQIPHIKHQKMQQQVNYKTRITNQFDISLKATNTKLSQKLNEVPKSSEVEVSQLI